MMTALDIALADVYREEIRRRKLTAVEMQARTGIPDRTWRNYFGSLKTPPRNAMPAGVVHKIAEAMGAQAWELMRTAQERVANMPAEPGDWLEDGLSRGGRAALDQGRADHGVTDPKGEAKPPAKRRRRGA